MALTDFFRINLPYGLYKDENDEWFVFNREYMPLGWNSVLPGKGSNAAKPFPDLPIYTKYKSLTESKLTRLAWGEDGLRRDDKGDVVRIWLYNDRTNPTNDAKCWNEYFEKIKLLSSCEVKP